MAKKKGRLMLIKIGDGAQTEQFLTLCSLTSKSFRLNDFEVRLHRVRNCSVCDCDNPTGALWTEVLNGIKRASLSGNGLIEESTAEARLMAIKMSDEPFANTQVIVPGVGTFVGRFHYASVEFTGEQEGGQGIGLTLNSSGAVTFTEEA